jgi:hypothetical protein
MYIVIHVFCLSIDMSNHLVNFPDKLNKIKTTYCRQFFFVFCVDRSESELATEIVFLHIVISLSVLLFAAKLFAELFHRINMSIVLGKLLAGIAVGPFALGSFLCLMESL